MKEKDLKEHLANTLAWLRLERDENPDFISDDALQFIAANMIGALKWASNSFDEQEFIDGVNREYDYKAYVRSKGNCMRIAKQEKII